jgi:hypothetical protein
LAVTNTDAEQLRLDSMLRDGIEPRISGLRFRWVPGFPKGDVLIIRVPRSLASPHMVKADDADFDTKVVLRPLLNALWQAAGYSRCLDFTEAGAWTQR